LAFSVQFIRFELQDPNFEITDADLDEKQLPFRIFRGIPYSGEGYKDPRFHK